MSLIHNLSAMRAAGTQKNTVWNISKAAEKLSSGYRINRAADDSAGLSISEKMRAQIRGLAQAELNVKDAASVVDVGDGALQEVNEILNRMTELSVKAANGTYSNTDRSMIQKEVDALKLEINRIAYTTEILACKPLFDGFTIGGGPAGGYLSTLTGCDFTNEGRILMNLDGAGFPLGGTWQNPLTFPHTTVKDEFGREVNFRLCDTGVANLTRTKVSDDPANNLFIFSYDDGDFVFDIQMSYSIVDKSSGSELKSYYNYGYEFINKSTKNLSFDMTIIMDMLTGTASNAVPEIDGVTSSGGYRYSGSNIPGNLNFDSTIPIGGVDTSINIESIFTGPDIITPPDVILSGNTIDARDPNNLTGPDGKFSNTTDDYFYTIGWKDKELTPGGSIVFNNLFGVTAPRANPGEIHGTRPEDLWVQTGSNAGDGYFIPLCNATLENLELTKADVSTANQSLQTIGMVDKARFKVLGFRTTFGAYANRLKSTESIIQNTHENLTASESQIRDTKMDQEILDHTKQQILLQVSDSLLAQANKTPEQILKLLTL